MYNHLDENDLANTVRMMRTTFHGVIILVEGYSDVGVYKKCFDDCECELLFSHGKANTIGALIILNNNSVKGILAIVDADFDRVDGNIFEENNLFYTDYHDLESMILSSNAFKDIFHEYGNDSKIQHNLRSRLFNCGACIGYFRWISSKSQENLYLKFKGINFLNFIDKKTLEIDRKKLINEVARNSNQNLDIKCIEFKILELEKARYDLREICSGHDLVEILYIGLKYIFGNRKAKKLTPDILSSNIRLSYNFTYFSESNLFAKLKKWEKDNFDYRIFKI